MKVVFKHGHLIGRGDPMDSELTFVRIESGNDCDGVYCQHPGMPDAPPHEHLLLGGESPWTQSRVAWIPKD